METSKPHVGMEVLAAGVPPLVGYLDGLVEQLRGHVPRALREFDAGAVHQARVCTRRLSAALSLLEPLAEPRDVKDFRKSLRKLRRRLGPLRDADVLIARAEELGETGGAGGAYLLEVLRGRREALRREVAEEARVGKYLSRLGAWEAVREEVARHGNGAGGGIGALLAEGVHAGLDEFTTLADLLAAGSGPTGGIDPHELRIAGKHLRYALELTDAAELAGLAVPREVPSGQSVHKTFKKMQDLLGEWHDEVVLAETALGAVAEAGLTHRDGEVGAAVLSFAAEALVRSSGKLADFRALWSEQGPGLTGTLREGIRLTTPAEVRTHPEEWPVAEGKGGKKKASGKKRVSRSARVEDAGAVSASDKVAAGDVLGGEAHRGRPENGGAEEGSA